MAEAEKWRGEPGIAELRPPFCLVFNVALFVL